MNIAFSNMLSETIFMNRILTLSLLLVAPMLYSQERDAIPKEARTASHLNCCNLPPGAYYEYITKQNQALVWNDLTNIHGGIKDGYIDVGENRNYCALYAEVEVAVRINDDGSQEPGVYYRVDKYESDVNANPVDNTYFSTLKSKNDIPKFHSFGKKYPKDTTLIIAAADDLGKPLPLVSKLRSSTFKALTFRYASSTPGPVLALLADGPAGQPGTVGIEIRPIAVQVVPSGRIGPK